MSYRDDLDAAHARIAVLEKKLAESQKKQEKPTKPEQQNKTTTQPKTPLSVGYPSGIASVLYQMAHLFSCCLLAFSRLHEPSLIVGVLLICFFGWSVVAAAKAETKETKPIEDRPLSVIFIALIVAGWFVGFFPALSLLVSR